MRLNMFTGRKKELKELENRYNSGKFEFGVIFGARRIGKTSLIYRFAQGKNAFIFQARRGTKEDNLRVFTREFNRFRGMSSHYRFDSFEAALDEVAEYAGDSRFLFVIDEVAYLCFKDKAFLSTLQHYIDNVFIDKNIMLILSGSNISFMEDILESQSDPLYKRATFSINVKKLPYSEALEMLDGVKLEDKLPYLSVFGEYPYYLAMINKTLSFEDNMKNLLFNEYGTLVDAPDKVLPSGISEKNTYNSILMAIAQRKRFSKDIADSVGEDANYIAKYLSSLVMMQVIEKRESFNRNQKLNYYEISDPLLKFWYGVIIDNKELITMGMGDIAYNESKEKIKDYISHGFEEVVLSYMRELNINRKLPNLYGEIRNYKVDNSQLGRSIELDGLASGIGSSSGCLLVIECKYRKKPISKSVYEHIQESVSIFGTYKAIDYYIFSLSGFSDDISKMNDPHLHLVSAEDMLKN